MQFWCRAAFQRCTCCGTLGTVAHWHIGKVSPLQEKNPKKGLHFRSWITKQSFTRSCFKIVLENFTSHPGMKILGKVSLIKQSTCNTWSPALISCVSASPGRLSTGPGPQRGKLAARPWPVHRYRRSGYVRPPADGLICCPLFITPLLATNPIWLCSAWGFFPCLICGPLCLLLLLYLYFNQHLCAAVRVWLGGLPAQSGTKLGKRNCREISHPAYPSATTVPRWAGIVAICQERRVRTI